MYKNVIPFLIALLFSSYVYPQKFIKFTEEPEAYLQELEDFFARDQSNTKKTKELIDQFKEPWLEGGFSANRQKSIYEISNLLLARGARNFPHFYDYIQSVLTYRQVGMDSVNYFEWEDGLRFLSTNKKSKLSDIEKYLNAVYYLVTEKAIYYSNSLKWYTDNPDYKIIVDNDSIKIEFSHLNLTGKLRNDSIMIEETSGTYYPMSAMWYGDSARVYWEKAGLPKHIAWAEVGPYSFKMNKASYTIENIDFYNKNYFDYSLKGTLTDKIVEVKSPESLSYPRFESNLKNFSIKGIFNDIDYFGGFSMQGGKFIGTGSDNQVATLSIFRNTEVIRGKDTIMEKQLFMKTSSQFYAFRATEIVSRNCKISMYIDKDSIYHPGLLFRYYDKNREIDLIRDKDPENMSRSPYYDTYHKIEMDFELLRWNMDKSSIDLTMLRGSSINIANFESQDFFNAARYYEVQGQEEIHPFISIRRFANKYHTQVFHVEDLAGYMRYSLVPIKRMLIDFTYRGLVDFDSETGICTIKPKLYKYLDDIVGQRDYDLINFESRTMAPLDNAILNLKNMDLEIKGVPMINVSDSQNVVFYPKNQEILLKKNRDFDFNGRVEVGFFTFYGDNFQFKYDSFKVALNQVDSLSIKVKAGVDNWGRRLLANVENVIEDVTGDVAIDDPGNKSGIKKNPKYPIFESKKNSFVYYDAKNIQDGKYTRDKFYFNVDPYTIDSLNDFSPEGLGYEGEFHSSDIFPVMREKLVLQPDNSLGFHHKTPDEGLPVFQGKGQYFSDFHLSNQGLRGSGELTYLTSKAASDDFIFFPDSANAYTSSFTIGKKEGQVQYPDVTAEKVYMHWMPYQDELYSNSLDKPYVMYADKARHSGKLMYSPKELTGSGQVDYYKSELTADNFKFEADRFNSDSANFKLNSVNADKLAFVTDSVKAKVDFIEMKSTFHSNTGTSKADLQENLYAAYIEQFSWQMDKQTMHLSTPNTVQVFEHGKTQIVSRDEAGLESKGSLFVSTHSGQDSLNWISAEADFDLKTNTIFAHQVKYIDVADAEVYPDKGEVVVETMANMRTLKNARVLADTATRYHRFHGANISISSRSKYQGDGKYDYEDEVGRILPISFDLIAVDSTGQTFAQGSVKGIDDFSLSPAFAYRGKVSLEARNPFLYFDGYTMINQECNAIAKSWLKFESEIDPKNIFIPLDEQPKDINDGFLVSGAMLATDSIHVFPAFVSPRERYSNLAVITAGGYLTYKKNEKNYIIGEKYRIANKDTTGNILKLQKNLCFLSGEGTLDLTANLGQVKLETKGNALYKLDEDKLKLELLMTVDFYFPEACIKFIADTLATMTALKPIDLRSRTYNQGIKELLPAKEADDLLNEQSIFGTVKKVPDKLATTFVFSDLDLVWNKTLDAWQSTGELGIANVLGTQINRKIKGDILITRRRSGDSFDLYLEISENHWYYFNYNRGLMQAYSSEAAFNDIIANIKGSDRKLKVERGEASYVFFLSNNKKRTDFLKKLGGEKVDDEDNNNNTDYKKYDDFD